MSDSEDPIVIKDQIVEAMLDHVPFDGWSEAALKAGLLSVYDELTISPAMAHSYFQGGLMEMADHYADWLDRKVERAALDAGLDGMGVTEKIHTCIRLRLQLCHPHREAVRKLVTYLSLPQNSPSAAKMAWRTCSRIWYLAGDQSADWNHYSKRGLLVSVYGMTMLYWLGDDADEQDDYPDTWAFLDSRLKNVVEIFSLPKKITQAFISKTGALFPKRAFQRR